MLYIVHIVVQKDTETLLKTQEMPAATCGSIVQVLANKTSLTLKNTNM